MQIAAAAGGAATISAVLPQGIGRLEAADPPRAIVKPTPPELFYQSGSNLEMRWEAMYNRGTLVPTEMFFVRNNSAAVPRIDPAAWRLRVEGSGLSRPGEFSYEALLAMPSISMIKALECAGNGRNFFEVSHGKKIPGTPWNLGGIGVAEWTGVPLREVLERAGVKPTAREVMAEGLDEKKVSRPIPIDKAMEKETLLVYAMNGQPLLPDHGFPLRLFVPGWVGIANIKWVGRLEVSEQPLYSEYNTKRYVFIGPDYPPQPPALGPMLTTQKVKSAFELPWNGTIAAGRRLLRGRSWSGEGRITRVEVSLDGGQTWQPARLREPNQEQAWVRWDLDWEARPGIHRLQARATDNRGNRQPDKVPFNEEGYAYWAVVTHTITAT
ncbi:MAG: sulfite oxidase [Deltaproteobacteria bacterium]|nr:sulfite oxidase [Deltaproteobacteria bacterium]